MRTIRSLASWCFDVVLWIGFLALLLGIFVLPIAESWNWIAGNFGLPMLNSLRLLAYLIFLATIAIIIFFLYFGLKDKVRKTKWWRAWQQILRLVQAKVRKRG